MRRRDIPLAEPELADAASRYRGLERRHFIGPIAVGARSFPRAATFISFAGMSLLLALAMMQAQPSIEGRWRSPGGNSIIDIAPCGGDLCGTVAWASEKAKEDARKGGTEELIGAQLLTGLKEKSAGRWNGKLFIPDINKRSNAKLELNGAGQLKVSGCLIGKMLCKSQIWNRVDGPVPD